MCGAGAHAPSGPPWTSTTVGSGPSPASGGEAIQVSIGPPAPGASVQRHDRLRVAALPGGADRASGRAGGRCRAVPARARASTAPSRASRRSRATRRRRSSTTASEWTDDVAVGQTPTTRSAGRSRDRSMTSHGCDRPRSETAIDDAVRPRPRRARCGLDHPARRGRVSTQLPIGRSRSGVSVDRRRRPVGRAEEEAGADVVERVGLDDPDGGDPPPVGGVGRAAGRAGRREDLARLGVGRVDIDGPDRRPRAEVGIRAAVGGERTVRPSGLQVMPGTPQSPRVTWRGRAPRADVDDEEVRPVVEVADARRSASPSG